jgi:O-antigen/teichoic acid export membrane protein
MSGTAQQKGVVHRAAAYSLLGALPRAIGFLMLPIYTHVLGPSEYGRMSVAMSIYGLLMLVMSGGLDLSIFRDWFRLSDQPELQRQWAQSAWAFLIVFPWLLAAVLGLIATLIGGAFTLTGPELALTMFAAAAQISSTTMPTAVVRAQEDLRRYFMLSLSTTIPMVVLAILFVVEFRWGVTGWIASIIVGQTLSLFAALFIVPWTRSMKLALEPIKVGLRFGIPQATHYLFSWSLNLSDRLILTGLVTSAALGAYSLGANLAMPVLVLVMAINQAVQPAYARFGIGQSSRRELSSTVAGHLAAVALITTAVALLGQPLVGIIAPSSFAAAGEVVGWIALGFGFLGCYLIPMNIVSLILGKNLLVWIPTAIGAAANIILLLILVPEGGIKAAGIASAAGYLVVLIGMVIYAAMLDRSLIARLPLSSMLLGVGLSIAVFAAASATSQGSGLVALAERSGWVLALAAILAAVNGVRPQRLQQKEASS